MLQWLRERKARKNDRKRLGAYNRGFDWAAGVLLRGELTVVDVEALCDSYNGEDFDAGAMAAVNKLCRLGVVTDER